MTFGASEDESYSQAPYRKEPCEQSLRRSCSQTNREEASRSVWEVQTLFARYNEKNSAGR